MAWVTPTNVATGDVLTASKWNQEVVENTRVLRGDYAEYRYTTGNITLTGTTSWSNLTTIGTAGDLVLAAATGDVVEVCVSMLVGNEAVNLGFDAVTVVGGTVTNSFALNGPAAAAYTGNNGYSAWWNAGGVIYPVGGSAFYKLVSGDISSSTVTVRIRYAMAAATNRLLYAASANPLGFFARNHGPVEV
jgi:hypothetical protein